MNKKFIFYMGLATLCLISFLVFSKPLVVEADHISNHDHSGTLVLETLNEEVYKLYHTSKDANKMAAYSQVQKIKRIIVQNKSELSHDSLSFDLFEEELAKLEGELASSHYTNWADTVAKLYLASDALVQGEKGPWREYEALLLERLRHMENAFLSQTDYDINKMQANLSIVEQHLERITLAVKLLGYSNELDELHFRIVDLQAFIVGLSYSGESQQYYTLLEHAIYAMKQATLAMFSTTQTTTLLPIMESNHFPLQIALLLSTLIFLTLSYVSFRKYKQTPYGIKKL